MSVSRYKTTGTVASPPYEAPKAIATGSGCLRAITIGNKGTVPAYAWICDSTDSTGAVLYTPFIVDTDGERVVSFGPSGLTFTAGCFVAMSSTRATYTAIASADFNFNGDLMPADTVVAMPTRMQA